MADSWIKMRGALTEHPKVIALTRFLLDQRGFREWLTPGGSGAMNGQIVSDEALRCVTCALLLRVWSRSREHGKFDGNDLLLPHNTLEDLDQMACAPFMGEGMASVGWAVETEENGVILPNFKEYNIDPAEQKKQQNAERQRRFREKKSVISNVTSNAPVALNSNTRLDKIREEDNTSSLSSKEELTLREEEEISRDTENPFVTPVPKPILADPLGDFSADVRQKTRDIFHRYSVRRYGNLPNLAHAQASKDQREIASRIEAFPDAHAKLFDYFAKPPADRHRSEKLYMILDFLDLNSPPKAKQSSWNSSDEKLLQILKAESI